MKTPEAKPYLYGRFRKLKTFTPLQLKDFKKYIVDSLLNRISTQIRNKHTGINIKISKAGLKHTLSYGINENKIKSLTALDDVLKTAFLVDALPDKNNKKLKHFKFKNWIRISGEIYFMDLNVKEDSKGNFYYHHELTQIKKPAAKV